MTDWDDIDEDCGVVRDWSDIEDDDDNGAGSGEEPLSEAPPSREATPGLDEGKASSLRAKAEQRAKERAEKSKKSKTLEVPDDLYEVLGLGNIRWKATAAQLKTAYRKMILVHHPDKAAEGEAAVAEERFKRIQLAYDTLTDEAKRRDYDSQDPFDDNTPSSAQAKEACLASEKAAADGGALGSDFFDLFGPVFERNARWSAAGAEEMPALGGPGDDIATVTAFYSAWFAFKSKRSFSHLNEFTAEDLEEAEFREERRWMERRNAAMQKSSLKAERSRIGALVSLAERWDPRLRAHRRNEDERKAAAKRAVKEAKEARIREETEARERKAREERESREAKEKAAAAARQKATALAKARRKKQNRFREAAKRLGGFKDGDKGVELVAETVHAVTLVALTKAESRDDFMLIFNECHDKARGVAHVRAEKAAEAKGKKDAAEAAAKKVWTKEEVSALAKATRRFPPGTQNRYEVIRDELATGRTTKEIIAKIKEVTAEVEASKESYAHVGAEEEHSRVLGAKREKAQLQESLAAASGKNTVDVNWEQRNAPAPEPAKAKEPAKAAAAAEKRPEKAATPAAAAAAATAAAPAAAAAATAPAAGGHVAGGPETWSEAEQKRLEAALGRHPASLGKERWARVSEDVGTRSKKQCVERFKFVRDAVLAAKGGTGAAAK